MKSMITARIIIVMAVAAAITAGAVYLNSCLLSDDGVAAELQTKDPQSLSVLSATPVGLVSDPDEFYSVVVVFNKAMVPLQALPEGDGSGPLVIDPPVPGKFRWLGTNTLSFTPTERLRPASRYRLTVPAGTRSASGLVLKEAYTWTFETTRPMLIKSNLYDDAQGVTINPIIYLLFSQAMDAFRLKDGVQLWYDPTGQRRTVTVAPADSDAMKEFVDKYAYSYSYDYEGAVSVQNLSGRLFTAIPERPLDLSTAYRLVVVQGLRGTEGELGTKDQTEILFRTYGPLTITNFGEPANPTAPVRIKFSNPVNAYDLRERLSISPEAELIDAYETYWDENYSTSIMYKLKPRTEYVFRISGSTQDQFGNTLGQDFVQAFRTGDFATAVHFPRGQHILESHLSHDLNVSVLNPGAMSVNLARLHPLQVIRMVQADFAWNAELTFRDWAATSVLSNDLTRNQQHLIPIHLDPAIGSAPGGMVLVEFWHDLDQSAYPNRAIVQVTDIGITGKFSKQNNVIYVTSLETGKPLAGATIQILDDEGIIRYTGVTDGQGLLSTPGWEALAMKAKNQWSEPTQWVFVSHMGQEAMTSSDARLELYRFNVPWNWNVQRKDRFEGYVFTNQGLYRPGDKVLVKGLLRKIRHDALMVAADELVKVVITNPSYEEIFSREFATGSFGSFDFEYDIDVSAALGYYGIRISIGGEEISSQNFQVQEFRPVETEVVVTTSQPEYVWGEHLKGVIDAHYLFGMPVGRSELSWSVTRTKTPFRPEGYDGYYFGDNLDEYYYGWEGRYSYSGVLASGVTQTSDRGLAPFDVDLRPEAKNETSTLVVEGTVQDKNRQTVSGRKALLVHAGSYYLGLKPSTTFLPLGQPLLLDMLAVRPNGKKTSGQSLKVELIRREWVSVREHSSDGSFYWTSQMKDSVEAIQTPDGRSHGATLTFLPRSTGYYVLRASGVDEYGNPIQSSCYAYVTGAGYAGWRMNDDDAVDLVVNKNNFNPGDKARILVKSPYEGCMALVTIERDGILSHRTLTLKGNADVIEVPVTRDMIPNAFVSVILVKGRTELPTTERLEDLGKPGFKIGYVKLAVNADENRLRVDLHTATSQYTPGSRVDVRLTVKDRKNNGVPAEVTLYVEDIGVLNLVNYQTPQPFDHFYRHRELGVTTTENRRYILDQVVQQELKNKGGVGGGGGDEMYAAVAVRRNFKSCVYWNPRVLTDASGTAHVSFELPDNLTSFKIIAMAHTRDSKFGSHERTITVAKQLMLRPALPRFARVGDEIEAGVIVHNYTGREDTVWIQANVDGLVLKGSPTRSVFLKKDAAEEVRYRFRVDRSGTAVFTFKGAMKDVNDGVEVSIPMKIPSHTETVALYGSTTGRQEEKVVIPGDVLPEYGGLDVRTSSTAFVDLDGSMQYLFGYPYGCLEQKTSKVLPIILFGDVVKAFGFDRIGDQGLGLDETVQAYLDEVPKYQTYSGGFSYWMGDQYVSPYVSVYAMLALIKAKEKGYAVSSDCYDKGFDYLKKAVRQTSVDQYGLFYRHITNAFALAVLSEAGYYDGPTAELLFQRKDELPVYAQAMLLKAIVKGGGNRLMADELKRTMVNSIKMSSTTAHFEEPVVGGLEYTFHSNLRTTAAVLQTSLEMEGDRLSWAEKVVRYILQERKIDRWRTTQENAYVFWALGTYFKTFEKENPDFTSDVLVDGRQILTEMYRGRTLKSASHSTPLKEWRKDVALPLEFAKTGSGRLYYSARLTYAPAPKGTVKARDEGLAIEKSYSDASGQVIADNRFKAGEVYMVTVKVRTPQDRHFVVVDDPLPAGLEAINVNLATTSMDAGRQTTSMARTSWWWWDEGTFNKSEMRDDRVVLFADRLKSGSHTFTYLVRATSFGTFSLPVTRAEEMYNPDVFGHTSNRTVMVL